MEPRDPLMGEDGAGRFEQAILTEMMRQGVDRETAQRLYDASPIPEGLNDAPEYYLHESPYYWATYLLTDSRRAPQVGRVPRSGVN